MASAEFWYEFASTYSYPAALRVGALAEQRGVSLVWRPFLLGPIFAAQGWRDSPFNIYPAKGRYMWRDLERTCKAMGVPLKRPEPFPQPSLLAARVALALEGDERVNFSRRVFAAEFGEGMADRRSRDSRRAAGRMRRRSGSGVRAGRKRRQQGAAQGRVRPGGGDRRHRRALSRHPGRRSVLGQRPARTGAQLGRGRPRRRRRLRLGFFPRALAQRRSLHAARRKRTPTGSPGYGCATPGRLAFPSACR